ncbi:glycoside hydrolase family 65 protein [Candidatus Xianfuyuplasma coldseepsis]|uniref:Glycoside hydrolase family 65 protein n=1 Tax=Candidatus Xianfuyuplasma coldseepsis TaxID=2782163 RepID=A0A7L7KQT9_9MOLU|nr:glycosyl hydrolase family 65 protein [Xianfuyuplasma coldseepsis]QMS84799.1 glycoside hydrolase family 65 protein [Xianfuyuplasma coldseepsis]
MIITRDNRLHIEQLQTDESIFATQNGYIGVRGTFCEGYGTNGLRNGTFINSFYEEYPYRYEENLSGFAQKGQAMIHVIDGQGIEFYIDNHPLNMESCDVVSLHREFHLYGGYTTRTIHYKTPSQYEFILTEKRLTSLEQPELFVVEIDLQSLNYSGHVEMRSTVQQPQFSNTLSRDPRIGKTHNESFILRDIHISDDYGCIQVQTKHSKLEMAVSVTHNIPVQYTHNDKNITATAHASLTENEHFTCRKYVIYTSSNYHSNYVTANNILRQQILKNQSTDYFEQQRQSLTSFWKTCEIAIDGNERLQLIMNYNVYQLHTSGGLDSRFNIGAKGLTGDGYEGHHFWDTEIYLLPFFVLTNPQKAKTLLLNRYHNIEAARQEALNLGHTRGIKIPWRSITGRELSPYYPAGTAQYHINSDVAYAVIHYYYATDDMSFMLKYGFELLVETARTIYDIGHFHNGVFHIHEVTGPDEYTTCVDDNYYTNSMAQYHFQFIVDFYDKHASLLKSLITRMQLSDQEIKDFNQAAESMAIIYDETLQIIAQDQTFLSKEPWDLEHTPSSNFPLLLHYHPLQIYRKQVLKQADVLLSMFLLDFEDKTIMEHSYDYYSNITTHDSSLSKCVHSIVASALDKLSVAYDYMIDVSEVDMSNTQRNTKDGLHLANLGGSYMTIVYGLAGLRIKPDRIILCPRIPHDMNGYSFTIQYRQSIITISISDTIQLTSTNTVDIELYGNAITLQKGTILDYPLG